MKRLRMQLYVAIYRDIDLPSIAEDTAMLRASRQNI
jgi:hypothetical protein